MALHPIEGQDASASKASHPRDTARPVLGTRDERAALSPIERLLIELSFHFGVEPAESSQQ